MPFPGIQVIQLRNKQKTTGKEWLHFQPITVIQI